MRANNGHILKVIHRHIDEAGTLKVIFSYMAHLFFCKMPFMIKYRVFKKVDGWMKWGFTSFVFAQDRLIRTARDHSNEVKCTHGTE